MVVAVKIPGLLHKKFSFCDVDMPVVPFDFVPNSGYPLRFGELLVDAQCDIPLLEP